MAGKALCDHFVPILAHDRMDVGQAIHAGVDTRRGAGFLARQIPELIVP